MASITVRNLDEELKRRLRIRAAENGRSMEQEVRDILRAALDEEPPSGKTLSMEYAPGSPNLAALNWNCRRVNLCVSRQISTEKLAIIPRYSHSYLFRHYRLRDYPQAYSCVEHHQRQHRILPSKRESMARGASDGYRMCDID